MDAACLLLHGFAGTPFEVAPLAPPLQALGLRVEMPLLPGHGATQADFRRTFFPDWLAAAERAYDELAAGHERVFVGGFSMGGALALLLAASRPAAGVMALATPMWLYRVFPWQMRDIRLVFLPVLRHLLSTVPMPRRSREAREISPTEGYEGFMSLAQLHSLGRGLAMARRALPRVRAPLLIAQDARDGTVGAKTGEYIARKVSSTEVTLHLTHAEENVTRKHLIVTHRETRDQVIAWCVEFVRRLL